MFEETGNRIGDLLRRSFDLAIEFATLGEYGLGGPRSDPHWASWAPAEAEQPQRLAVGPVVRPKRALKPSTVAARAQLERFERAQAAVATTNVEGAARDCGARTMAGRSSGRIPRKRRSRGGAPPPPTQPCTTAEGEHG